LGVAFDEVPRCTFYPIVALHSPGETISANFGQKSFKFDLDAMIGEQKEKMMVEVKNLPLQGDSVNILVRNYLLYYGYGDTVKSFESASGIPNQSATTTNLQNRKRLRQLITSGDIPATVQTINELYPNILEKSRRPYFLLTCQHFIELINLQKLGEAVDYAQRVLSQLRNLDQKEEQYLQNVLGLFAYGDLRNSPVSHLLGMQQREIVADAVNELILNHSAVETKQPSLSNVETLIRQLIAVQNTARSENGNRGEVFCFKDYV